MNKESVLIPSSQYDEFIGSLPIKTQYEFETLAQLARYILTCNTIVPAYNSIEEVFTKYIKSKRDTGVFSTIIKDKIIRRMNNHLEINFVVIATSHKNPSKEVTGGKKIPDLGEFDFLLHMASIIDQIKSVYSPGASFTILTEGGFYNLKNIFDVTNSEIENYQKVLRLLISQLEKYEIKLIPLENAISDRQALEEEFHDTYKTILPFEYEKYIPIMQHSITQRQLSQGVTPEQMAKKYVALHLAKHRVRSKKRSFLYEFLENRFGPDYIYCSITTSSRPEVLNIDTSKKHQAKFPQHGLGLLRGGTSRIDILPFTQLINLVNSQNSSQIRVHSLAEFNNFGIVKFK